MTSAMKSVADGLFGINKAAHEFGVPRTAFKDRLSGKVVHGTKLGPSPYWSGVFSLVPQKTRNKVIGIV